MLEATEFSEPQITASELVQLLLSTFPPPILWAYKGAYAHLIAEVFHICPSLVEHVVQRDAHAFFRDMARLSAVVIEDIRYHDPHDPDAKDRSAMGAISQIMTRAGLTPIPTSLDSGLFLKTFHRCAMNWDLEGLAALFQSRWRWPA